MARISNLSAGRRWDLDPAYVAHHDAKVLILKDFLASAAKGYTSAQQSAKEICAVFLRGITSLRRLVADVEHGERNRAEQHGGEDPHREAVQLPIARGRRNVAAGSERELVQARHLRRHAVLAR